MKRIKIYPHQDIDDRIVLYTVCEATHEDISSAYVRNHNKRSQKPVFMYTMRNVLAGYFKSLREASKQIDVTESNISKALDKPTRSAGGYRWSTKPKKEHK